MPLSSNTLFHFTGSAENLLGILEHEFRPRLSLESFAHIACHIPESPWMDECAFPMVCFCDIPLSQVSPHMETYGDYGIGLSKEWGMKNGISPVLYIHANSRPARNLAHQAVLALALTQQPTNQPLGALALDSSSSVYFSKPYEGWLERRGRARTQVRFYNEREWRYVPEEVEDIPAVSRPVFTDPLQRAPFDAIVDKLPALSFEPGDIRYLVVAKDAEVPEMIFRVREIKHPKYSGDTIALLASRIVSAERIRADF